MTAAGSHLLHWLEVTLAASSKRNPKANPSEQIQETNMSPEGLIQTNLDLSGLKSLEATFWSY